MRRSLLLILTGALMLLLVSVSSGYAGHTRAITRDRNELAYDAAEQAQVLNAYFARARSIILLTAHVPEFGKFYALPGTRADRIRRGGPAMEEINKSLAYLHQLYPDRIGEACFIDASGAELARTVRGQRATYDTLSPDESKNPFFAPTFALSAGEVYQAKPYVSPDTNEWVISNSTPLPMEDGTKPAIVHFEVTLGSFRREAITRSTRTVLVVDADTGRVVLDSTRPQQVDAPLGDPTDTRFRGLVGRWSASGQVSIGGHQAAYQRITDAPGNANHWFVVSIANDTTDTLTGVGFLPVLIVVATLLLIGLLLIAMRRAQRALMHAAHTDILTGLGNRRQLVADLEAGLARATNDDPLLLILCDLNGFKQYNDTFGHPAGDALLARLGAALARGIGARGRAYRIGGDEFCVLARGETGGLVEAAARALSEHGEGFSITASYGAVVLPADAAVATEAMRVVDLRMYENKNSSRVPADLQTTNVLVRAVQERDHEWGERLRATADLAVLVC
ncbi:MAG TPA: GGDEF domain-containing protein, partial [Actinoplanes sp.]|nr:GGDEF domain-containing protein [Actinoplanes sp.]